MKVVKQNKSEFGFVCTWISVVTMLFLISTFSCSQQPESSPPHQQTDMKLPHNLQPEVWIAPQLEATALDGGSVDIAPSLVSFDIPEYPQLPRVAGIQGYVEVEVIVDVAGKVKEAKIRSSTMPLATQDSTVETVKKYTFSPGMRDSKPIECRLLIIVNYDLR
jgi:TonB family protein